MRIGKLPEPALKRAVLKEITSKSSVLLSGAGCYNDASLVQVGDGEVIALTTAPVVGTTEDVPWYAINSALNNLAVAGATPVGVMLTVLIPDRVSESRLRQMMREISDICERQGVDVLGGHTQIVRDIKDTILTVNGIGVRDNTCSRTGSKKAYALARDLVVTKWIGLEGTARIAKRKRDDLLKRYRADLLDEAESFSNMISIRKEADIALRNDAICLHDASEGGIFTALWEMAETMGRGLRVDLKSIPIRQETVEVSEFFDINPYNLKSTGALLIACTDGGEMVKALEAEGIWATAIGQFTDNNDRTIESGDEVRYLDLPQADELYKII